jgi:uncharacterized YccA/Bax inhibitor family protein
MNLTKTSNPFFGKNSFETAAHATYGEETMTVRSTMGKTLLGLLFVMAAAFFTWQRFFSMYSPANPLEAVSAIKIYMIVGGIGGFVMAIIASFSPKRAGILTPIYAILQGVFLGGLSAMFEAQFPGMIMKAVSLTFAVFLGMLLIYTQRIIKVTSRFRKGMMAAIFGIMLVYVVGWISSLFGAPLSFLHGGGTFGLIFSLVVTGISAFSLLLDFDFIERGALSGAPKYMEWYGVFGLLVSLIWLYINILRLLSIFARRD